MAGKAQFQKTPLDITRRNVLNDKVLFGVSRQNSAGIVNVGGVTGSGQGQSIAPVSGYLNINGGSMLGPIGYYPKVKNLSYSGGIGHLDISNATGAYTSLVLLGAVGTLDLYWIDGAAFDGQELKILIPSTSTLHLHNGDGVTTGNIFTVTGSTVDVLGFSVITLTFSSSQNGWVIQTGANFANTTLSNLTSPTAINHDLLPHATSDFLNVGNDSHVFGTGNFSVVANVNNIIFGTNSGGRRWIESSGGLVYNVLTGEAHSFQVNNVEYMDVRGSQVNISGILTVSNSTNLNGNVSTDSDGTRTFGTSSLRFIINGFNYRGISKGAPTPSVTDIPSGYFQVMKDSRQVAGVGVKLWYNDSGTLVSTTLS